MSRQTGRSKAIKRLQTLKNIGPKMAEKLYALGIKTPAEMRRSDPEKLFRRLLTIDHKADLCDLYAFRGAVLGIPWWRCKNVYVLPRVDRIKAKRKKGKRYGR
jgi:hypothetical protein